MNQENKLYSQVYNLKQSLVRHKKSVRIFSNVILRFVH